MIAQLALVLRLTKETIDGQPNAEDNLLVWSAAEYQSGSSYDWAW
jgi:hypothetical protein